MHNDKKLQEALERAKTQSLASSRQKPNKATVEPPVSVQLPIWPESVRAVPNGFLRSALFGVLGRNGRRYVKDEAVTSMRGLEVKYTGERLCQKDLDVLESIYHVVREQDLGDSCRVTSYQLLRLLHTPDSGKNRQYLKDRIKRLIGATVEIKEGRYAYIGTLLDEAGVDEDTGSWLIRVNPKIKTLFSADNYTQVDWHIRIGLKGKLLAQWLHGFYSSHAQPFPIKIETIHSLCGSSAKSIPDFAKTLRNALQDLERVSTINGQPFAFAVEGGLVSVIKTPTKTQQKHLKNKAR